MVKRNLYFFLAMFQALNFPALQKKASSFLINTLVMKNTSFVVFYDLLTKPNKGMHLKMPKIIIFVVYDLKRSLDSDTCFQNTEIQI